MKDVTTVKSRNEVKSKKRGKRKMTGWIILLVIVAVLGVGGAIGWSYLSKEHYEARNVSLDAVDFSKLKDGTYVGGYEGGIYKWRTNKIQVTVSSGKVSDIKILESKAKLPEEFKIKLNDEVIKAQSLQVDAVSGATLDTRACLKGVENALIKAEEK